MKSKHRATMFITILVTTLTISIVIIQLTRSRKKTRNLVPRRRCTRRVTTNNSIEPGMIKHYVINLDSARKRWTDISSMLNERRIDYERITGYNSRERLMTDFESLSKLSWRCLDSLSREKRRSHGDHNIGSVGCYFSHIETLQRFLTTGLEYAIIIEDDITIEFGYEKELHFVLNALPPEWDVVMLGRVLYITERSQPPQIFDALEIPQSRAMLVKTPFCMTNHCMVSRKGANKILSQAYPVDVQWDKFLLDLMLNKSIDLWILTRSLSTPNSNDAHSCIQHSEVEGCNYFYVHSWEEIEAASRKRFH